MNDRATDGQRRRLLFVSASPEHAVTIERVFADSETCPADVTVVGGHAEAAEAAQNHPFDAILVDLSTASGRGLDLIEALRLTESLPPVIAMGDPDELVVAEAARRGAEAYLRCWSCSQDRRPCNCMPRHVHQAVLRHSMAGAMARLESERRRHLLQDQGETDKLLASQREIIHDLEGRQLRDALLDHPSTSGLTALVQWTTQGDLAQYYRHLARAYVVTGHRGMGEHVAEFARQLAAREATPTDVLDVHLKVVEELTRGLTPHTAGRIVARAGTLVLETMVRLAQQYQQRQVASLGPPMVILLVTRDEENVEALEAALSQSHLRSSLTSADTAEAAWEAIAEMSQADRPARPDLIMWDAETITNEDVPWIDKIQGDVSLHDIWQVLLSSPGSLPLVPTSFPQLDGNLTKPLSVRELLRLVMSMPDRWLSICRLDGAGAPNEMAQQ